MISNSKVFFSIAILSMCNFDQINADGQWDPAEYLLAVGTYHRQLAAMSARGQITDEQYDSEMLPYAAIFRNGAASFKGTVLHICKGYLRVLLLKDFLQLPKQLLPLTHEEIIKYIGCVVGTRTGLPVIVYSEIHKTLRFDEPTDTLLTSLGGLVTEGICQVPVDDQTAQYFGLLYFNTHQNNNPSGLAIFAYCTIEERTPHLPNDETKDARLIACDFMSHLAVAISHQIG